MPSGTADDGLVAAGNRQEASEVEGEDHRAGGDRAGEAGDERGPAGEERGDASEPGVQVDVLAAGPRPQRGQLRVGHRAGERQRPGGQPGEEEEGRMRHGRRDLRRREEDAAADDVGDDDRCRVERPEPAFEGGGGRGSLRHARDYRRARYCVSSWRSIGNSPSLAQTCEPFFR